VSQRASMLGLEWEAIPTLSTGSDGVTTVQLEAVQAQPPWSPRHSAAQQWSPTIRHSSNPCRKPLSVEYDCACAFRRDHQMGFLVQMNFWCEEEGQ